MNSDIDLLFYKVKNFALGGNCSGSDPPSKQEGFLNGFGEYTQYMYSTYCTFRKFKQIYCLVINCC